MREQLDVMRKRLRKTRAAMEDLHVTEDNGAAAKAKNDELIERIKDM